MRKMLSCLLVLATPLLVPANVLAQLSEDTNLEWASHHDLTSLQFDALYLQLRNKGLMMVDFEAYQHGNGVRYAMVWTENRDGRGWVLHRDLTSSQYGNRVQELYDLGWRQTDIEVYATPNGLRYAGIWIDNLEDWRWASLRGMTSEVYAQRNIQYRNAGRRLIDVEGYETSAGMRYAAIWVENSDMRDWTELSDMTLEEYQYQLNQHSAQGFALSDFETYETPNGTRYAAVWEKLPGPRARQVRTGRTELAFANLYRQHRDEGYRLHDFERYNISSGTRYGGVWFENDARFRYPLKQQINAAVESYLSANALPGISVAVMYGGQMVYRRGFGMADVQGNKVAHAQTVYQIASIAKPIGGVLAALIEQDSSFLNLNAATRSYLGSSMPAHHIHTVAELLAHLGCVPHYNTNPGIPNQTTHYNAQLAASQSFWNTGLVENCIVGDTRSYSTHGFTFVGAVLEAVTGRHLPELLELEIIDPLALSSLRVQYASANLPSNYDRAIPYRNNGNPGSYSNSSWKILGGGMEADAVDLVHFGDAVRRGELVSATVRDNLLWSPVRPNCGNSTAGDCRSGLGWTLGTVYGRRVAEHSGSQLGARGHLRVYRDDELTIAILSNRRTNSTLVDSHHPAVLSSEIANIILGAP